MGLEAFQKTRREKTPEGKAFDQGMQEGVKVGHKAGRAEERAETLTVLERLYLSKEVKRGDVRAEAILQVARDLAEHFRQNPLSE